MLSVELANRESTSSWKNHLVRLKERGLHGVRLAASDDHAGLKRAIMETLPEAHWQRCYVHFLRTALDYLPRNKPTTASPNFAGSTTATPPRRRATISRARSFLIAARYSRAAGMERSDAKARRCTPRSIRSAMSWRCA